MTTYDLWKFTDEAANDADRRREVRDRPVRGHDREEKSMPMTKQSLTRWTITSERGRELAWVTLDKEGIHISMALGGPFDSFAAREAARVLVAAADEMEEPFRISTT